MSPEHLLAAPILLPLATAALMLLLDERRHGLKAALSIGAAVAVLAIGAWLLARAHQPLASVYALGNWPAPWGIVLVCDRLSAVMVVLAGSLALPALVFSVARWDRAAPHFHSLAHALLAGLNGAFLTGDLFNLFVFFELLLAASYGLALHGSGAPRVRASLHYVVVNLLASLLFLVGVSLLYGVTGTLNMADMARAIAQLPAGDRALAEAGAAVLGIAFLVKAGMWPLGFWLPPAYSAASPPAAALFAILSKVGIYAVVRLWLLLFGGGPGGELLVLGGLVTLVFGIIGLLAANDLGRAASYSLVITSGTLLAATGFGGAALTAAALFYLVASTLGVSALFLLIELLERGRAPGANIVALTAEVFGLEGDEHEPAEEVGVVIPAAMAVLGLAFIGCALLVAGLPPLPGFIAKFAMADALLAQRLEEPAAWAMVGLVVVSGLAAIITLGRAGVRIFWSARVRTLPRVRLIEIAPVALLLAACIGLTVAAGPAMAYLGAAAATLHAPQPYIDAVLSP